jgi:hypothetical protein
MSISIDLRLTKKEVKNGSEQATNNQVFPMQPCLGAQERRPGEDLPEVQKSVFRCKKKNQEGVIWKKKTGQFKEAIRQH